MNPDRASVVPDMGPDKQSGDSVERPRAISERHARRVSQCFQENHAQMVHWLEAKTGSWASARDIVDLAFAKVLEVEHPENVGDVRPYVYKTAANLAARKAETAAIHRRIHQTTGYEPDREIPSPEPSAVEEQRLQILMGVLETLPPRVRLAVRFRFWDELPYAEITRRFREKGVVVTERTLKRWVAYGLASCRQEIERLEGEGVHE
jgi:RNA polymerase sigma factor (sigma-70 family)